MREIFTHHDGHGLAESIRITANDRNDDNGGASHEYVCNIGDVEVARLKFQRGPRNEPGSQAGIIDSVLLAIIADRMEGFQSGKYSDRTNALVLTKCQEAMHWLTHRADERARRNVLEKNVK